LMAALFLCLAQDEPGPAESSRRAVNGEKLFPTPSLWAFFVVMSFLFDMRDFTGSSMGSLGSLFMQNAYGFNLKETGVALSAMFLASVVSNPLFGHLSDRGRIRDRKSTRLNSSH